MSEETKPTDESIAGQEGEPSSSCNVLLSADRELSPGFVREVMDDLASMSGMTLWRVTGTWSNKGRTGTIDDIVEATTAMEAIARAWEPEDDRDVRTVSAEWLCPIECVKRDDSLSVVSG